MSKKSTLQMITQNIVLIRDRMWVWGHETGRWNNGIYGHTKKSTIGPVEGAVLLGLKNMFFVSPVSDIQSHFNQFLIPCSSLNKLVWSITGVSGKTSNEYRESVFKFAEEASNLVGFIMDDFFRVSQEEVATLSDTDIAKPLKAALATDELQKLHARRIRGGRLPISAVLYNYQISPRILAYIDEIDQISLWTWMGNDIKNIEKNFKQLENLLPPGKTINLGIYVWDFGAKKPMPVELMKMQCDFALKMLKRGRITDIIFLGTPCFDMDLESVNWLKQWIAEVGDQELQPEIARKTDIYHAMQ